MKKVYLLLAFFFALGVAAANAQSCHGSASATATSGKSCCASSKVTKAAAADPTIEQRKAEDGTVSYVRKETDAQGNVRFVSVQYDEATNAFVNVAPKGLAEGEKAEMTKKKAACCASGDSAKKSCAGEGAAAKKACCAGGASKKACAGEKAAEQ